MNRIISAAAILAILALLWFLRPGQTSSSKNSPTAASSPSTSTSAPGSVAQLSALNSQLTSPSERSTLADALNSPTADIRADLHIVSDILATFRTNFPHDGNPVGNNAEITAVLTGKNKLRVAFIPPDLSAINVRGELCDRWGTPFFFHAESGTRMEVRSAGPDKKLYTDDDAIFVP